MALRLKTESLSVHRKPSSNRRPTVPDVIGLGELMGGGGVSSSLNRRTLLKTLPSLKLRMRQGSYRDNPGKMRQLFPVREIRKKIKRWEEK